MSSSNKQINRNVHP